MKDRIIALLLALVMAFTAVPTALAADEGDGHDHDVEYREETADEDAESVEADEGALEWVLDHLGTLHIGGYGHIKPFASPDDQPWKDYRDRIYDVDIHFDEIEIENTDFWFDGCEHLQPARGTMSLMAVNSAPLLAASSSGHDCAIAGCTCTGSCGWAYTNYRSKNSTTHEMTPYCTGCGAWAGVSVSGSHTFRGNSCSLCGYTKACSHSSTRTEYTTNCTWQTVCTSCGEVISSGSSHSYSYGSWSYDNASTHSRSYYCTYGDTGTYYESGYHNATPTCSPYNATQHSVSSYCYTCSHAVGSTTYENHNFSYGNWQNYSASQHRRAKTCSQCGYTDYDYASHSITYGSWTSKSSTQHQRTKSCSCGYSGSETASHSFSYGSWENYNATQHRRKRTCSTCGYSDYEYQDHSLKAGALSSISDTQHKHTESCATCGYSTTVKESHSITYGSWTSKSKTQHQRTKSCSCGYSGTETASHSFSYGSWENYTATQHRRKRTCSTCGYSDYEYQDHSLKAGALSSISDTQHQHTESCAACGYSTTVKESHSITYGAWNSVDDAQHRRTKSCACGYNCSETADHRDGGGDGYCDDCGYEMIRFSVTVPSSLALTVSKAGTVYAAGNAAIVNRSTGAVKVTGITATAANGWTLVPYSTNMAAAKVDSKRIGFTVNGAATSKTGTSEALALGSGWTIARDASLPLSYHAVVSATSEAIPKQQVLTLVFVVDWT